MSRMTQVEVDRYNARRAHAENAAQAHPPVEDESQLHADISAECRRRGWLALHGSMAHKSRRTPGEFDFIILAPPTRIPSHDSPFTPRVFLIECKAKGGKLSVEQQAIHAHARKLGHTPHVVCNMADFYAIVNAGA